MQHHEPAEDMFEGSQLDPPEYMVRRKPIASASASSVPYLDYSELPKVEPDLAQPTPYPATQTPGAAAPLAADFHDHHHSGSPYEADPGRQSQETPLGRWDWGPETVALLVSAGCLIGLIAVLAKENHQPLSTWTLPLTLNTMVSILSVGLKAPLTFVIGSCLGQGKWSWYRKRSGPIAGFIALDGASRGPMGCLTLLWWLKSR